MKKSIKIFCVVMIISGAFAAISLRGDAADRGDFDYVLGIHFSSVAGKSSSFFFNLVDKVCDIILEKTGFRIKLEKLAHNEDIVDGLIDGSLDSGMVFPAGIIRIQESGGDVAPWVTYVVGGKRKAAYCVWHNKSVEISDVEEVIGKNILVVDYDIFTYIHIRHTFYEYGLDIPVWRVFNKFVKVPSANSAFFALAKGSADFQWANADYDHFNKVFAPSVSGDVSMSLCSKYIYSRGMFVINKQTVDKDMRDFAFDFMTKSIDNMEEDAKKYPDLMAAFKYAGMAKLEFIIAHPEELKYDVKVYDIAKEKGWVKEAEFLVNKINDMKEGESLAIRPDMAWCKESCGAQGAECVLACME